MRGKKSSERPPFEWVLAAERESRGSAENHEIQTLDARYEQPKPRWVRALYGLLKLLYLGLAIFLIGCAIWWILNLFGDLLDEKLRSILGDTLYEKLNEEGSVTK